MGLHYSTRMVSQRSHHIVHLLARQDNGNKNRLDQTSAAAAYTANIALTNWRVSTTVDMMINFPVLACAHAKNKLIRYKYARVVWRIILWGDILHSSRELERMKITDDMVSQAVELVELDEKELYERLGFSLTVWETVKNLENLQSIYLEVSEGYERKKRARVEPLKPTPYFAEDYLNQFLMSKRQLEEHLRLLFLRRDLMKKGKKILQKVQKKTVPKDLRGERGL